jgi:hypothetical protein
MYLAALSSWECGSYLHRSQELEVLFQSVQSEHASEKMVGVIKDYDLEIHYYTGKANVVADTLSHKARCNYRPAVTISGEESSVRITPIMD